MCGIAGQVSFDGGVAPAPLERMADDVFHRGPDSGGLWMSPDAVCGLSFRRLSIIDLREAANQPMLDPETGNVIVFNGEIYNFEALRAECEAKGDTFRTRSDTEVILALYRRHGTECLGQLRGMFAFAIWDARRRTLFFARDRVGKKPFHYAETPRGMVFCSELYALARHPAVSAEQDLEALELYLQLQYVPEPWSIYKQVRKLPPAHYGVLSAEGLRIERYWDVDYRQNGRMTEGEALEGFRAELREAVRLRMIADVPLGALLSGGVDSSVIVAEMAQLADHPVKTFSVGFAEEAFDETKYAAEAARICGTEHHPLMAHGDVAEMLPGLATAFGEPYADTSAVPSFMVCRAAREHVTVVLNGDGGDELLGGYRRFALPALSVLMGKTVGTLVDVRHSTPAALAFGATGTFFGRASALAIRAMLHPEIGSVAQYNPYWNDKERAALFSGKPELLPDWRRHWYDAARAHARGPIDKMLYFDNHTYLPGDLLVKMDIASMHFGLEARSPLLDHRLIEFCATLPDNLKVRGGTGKYLLKRLAEETFPRDFVYRQKMGFGIPLPAWLRGPLRPLLEETLNDRSLMELFDPTVIRDTLKRFFSQPEDKEFHAWRLWALLMYGLWRDGAQRAKAAVGAPVAMAPQ